MKKHVSEVELCTEQHHPVGNSRYNCDRNHKDDFCLLCGYFMEGDRLYMEIHGSNGAMNRVKDIDSSQPYVCMECVENCDVYIKKRMDQDDEYKLKKLSDFIKERKP